VVTEPVEYVTQDSGSDTTKEGEWPKWKRRHQK
jgi:hypothetical protein